MPNVKPSPLLIGCGGALLLVIAAVSSPLLGGGIHLGTALREAPWSEPFQTPDALIFWGTRIPRVLAALLAGGALALCGLALQSVLRNPLAEPYVLGVSAGAAMGKALAIILLPAALINSTWLSLALCFAGAMAPVLLLQAFAVRARAFSPVTLILAGTMLNIVLSAAMMLLSAFASPDRARQIQLWWMGSLEIAGYHMLGVAALAAMASAAVLVYRAPVMNLLSLDAVSAHSLGVNLRHETRIVLWSTTLLCSSVVALVGPIGFVGLVVPHALRRLVGSDHRALAPLCLIFGALFLLLCDLAGWRGGWMLPLAQGDSVQIPVGVITALVGGPLFLIMLLREWNDTESD